MNEKITSAEDFETIQGQPWYQYLSWQFPAMVGNVALEEWLKARVSDSRLISAVVKRCDAQSATLERLTAQQAESEQAHKETKSILAGYVKERDEISGILRPRIATISDPYQQAKVIMEKLFAAEKERDALARQIDELTKYKAKRHIIGKVLIDRSTGEVLDTPPDATTSAMKGKIHE